MQSSSKTEESALRAITEVLVGSQVAELAHDEQLTEWRLGRLAMRVELPDVLPYMRRLMHFSTATERILLEPLSTSPEHPATPVRS